MKYLMLVTLLLTISTAVMADRTFVCTDTSELGNYQQLVFTESKGEWSKMVVKRGKHGAKILLTRVEIIPDSKNINLHHIREGARLGKYSSRTTTRYRITSRKNGGVSLSINSKREDFLFSCYKLSTTIQKATITTYDLANQTLECSVPSYRKGMYDKEKFILVEHGGKWNIMRVSHQGQHGDINSMSLVNQKSNQMELTNIVEYVPRGHHYDKQKKSWIQKLRGTPEIIHQVVWIGTGINQITLMVRYVNESAYARMRSGLSVAFYRSERYVCNML